MDRCERREETSEAESDNSLLIRIELGHLDAMTQFYDRHASAVFTAALTVLGDPDRAENVLHEILLRVWRSPKSFAVYGDRLGMGLSMMSRRNARILETSSSIPK